MRDRVPFGADACRIERPTSQWRDGRAIMAAHSSSGIHHITAIASDPQRTLDFYTQVLDLRLVKLAVNFGRGTPTPSEAR